MRSLSSEAPASDALGVLTVFSPQPYAIGMFFTPQIIIQGWLVALLLVLGLRMLFLQTGFWIRDLIYGSPKKETLDYVPYFVVGEIAIGLCESPPCCLKSMTHTQ